MNLQESSRYMEVNFSATSFFGTNLPAVAPAWAVSISWPSPIDCLHPEFNGAGNDIVNVFINVAIKAYQMTLTMSSNVAGSHQMSN